ncbi:MAG: hypothetical protein OXC40_03525 [Proteobacteria bacterium]|nr:hypothetical protein [Pseudomonadota bacterium]
MTRKVDLPLAIGILLMPVIFGWFTIGKGYSKLTRTITFSWMLIFSFILFVAVTIMILIAPLQPLVSIFSALKFLYLLVQGQ